MLFLKAVFLLILVGFVLPVAGAAAWWSTVDRPTSWRNADWGATGVLPEPAFTEEAAIYVMTARTGGFKGAFAVHSWIVVKEKGEASYTRYDKVGWGSPVRRNAYPADAAWYSNRPQILTEVRGDAAERLIPEVNAAMRTYPHANPGDYHIWPGPNSNTFVAHVLRAVPGLDTVLPANAVGKDFLGVGQWFAVDPDGRELHLSAFGLVGLAIGVRSGIELHFLGQTFGVDPFNLKLKIPAFGTVQRRASNRMRGAVNH